MLKIEKLILDSRAVQSLADCSLPQGLATSLKLFMDINPEHYEISCAQTDRYREIVRSTHRQTHGQSSLADVTMLDFYVRQLC